MPRPLRELTPDRSPAHRLGAELRAFRVKAGHTQKSLGSRVNTSASLIGAVETGDRISSVDVIASCDDALGAGGALVALWRAAAVARRAIGRLPFATDMELANMSRTATLRHLGGPEDSELIRRWFDDDAEGNRRLAFYAQPALWFSLLGPTRHGWLVIDQDQPVGFLDIEVDGGCGYIAYYVAPAFRGVGYGNQALRLMLETARELGIAKLEGGVDPDNAASLAALKRAGFEIGPVDEEGMFPVTMSL